MGKAFRRRRLLAVVLGALLVGALGYGALAEAGPTTHLKCSPYSGYDCYSGGPYGGTYGSPGNTQGSTPTAAPATTNTPPPPVVQAATLEKLKLLLKLKGKLSLAALLHKGIVINITCNEPCTVSGSLLIPRGTAAKLHLARAHLVKIASGHAKSKEAGKVKLRIKATTHAAHRLRHTHRLKGTLKLTAKSQSGQMKRIKKKVTVKK